MIDFGTFEAFEGEKPDRLLNTHPDGTYLAMQVNRVDRSPAAIWSTETKRLVWSPEDAYGLSWLREGAQLAALQDPRFEDIWPAHLFAIYTWPQGQLLAQCPLKFPLGYVFDLAVSPTNDLAICQWADQCEFGFEFLTLHGHSVVHLPQQGYIKRGTNSTTRPVFQPDGHLWVCAYQDNFDWWIDKEVPFHFFRNSSVKVGKRTQLGALMVFHHTQFLGEIPLIVTVPAGYRPPSVLTSGFFSQETKMSDSASEEWGQLSDPVFLDADHIMIRLPSGESQIHELSGFDNEGLV